MKHIKRLTAVLLAAMLVMGVSIPALAKTAPPQTPGAASWELDSEHPVIIVHGIGQSEVFLYEDDNVTKVIGSDGEPVRGWPPKVDTDGLIPKLIFPLLGSLFLQSDIFLTSTLRSSIKEMFSIFQMDLEGKPVQNMQVDRWHRYGGKAPTSLGDLQTIAPEQREAALDNIPLEQMGELIGEDMMYYFTYDSFGNMSDTVDELYQLIQDLLKKHNTDKVNIIPISLGGTIMNALLERYKDKGIMDQFYNVVYVVAALDGSNLAGDLFTRQLTLDNESLYRTMIPSLVDGYLGYLINIALRLLPKRLVMKVVDAVIDGVVGDVVGRSTMIWALVPQAYYNDAAAEWLSAPEMANIKAQVEQYHKAQVNSSVNILEMKAKGVHCYAIVDYNFPMYNFVVSAKNVNADGLLQIASPSMGATSFGVNVPLPDDYEPKHPGYMDEERIVDASTGALYKHTWYFKDQDHERTGRNDIIMRLVMRLSGGKQAQDVSTMPEWPQFNYGRDGRWLLSNLEKYKDFDITAIASEADRAEFVAAYAGLKRQAEATIVVPSEDEAARTRFNNIMVKIGEWDTAAPQPVWEKALDRGMRFLSEAFYFGYGPRGFIDPIWRIWCD